MKAGLRSSSVWTVGLSHLGTFGLGNAIAAWIAVYLVHQYGLTLGLAATLGSIALLSGMFFRPLGGILLARNVIGSIPLLRVGTIMGFAGVALLALPLRFPPLAADRKSTRLNSSHQIISYAVFCLKKKKTHPHRPTLPNTAR